ncbi:MAG: MerR family DNA-binding transcriptional regulator [Candidatus Binatia bacterium]
MALTIGQVARAANVHVETLRYYERTAHPDPLAPPSARSSRIFRSVSS